MYLPIGDKMVIEWINALKNNSAFYYLSQAQQIQLIQLVQQELATISHLNNLEPYIVSDDMSTVYVGPFVINPYVIGNITGNEADAIWITNKLATSVFRYGLDSEALTETVVVSTPQKTNLIHLINLSVETIYYYEITATSLAGETYTVTGSFETVSKLDKVVYFPGIEVKSLLLHDILILQLISNGLIETESLLTTEPDSDDEMPSPEFDVSTIDIVTLNLENSTTQSDFSVSST